MFSVPGWSVSADSLKTENATSKPTSGSSKKRKRTGQGKSPENVTAANVADLWESVVEGKVDPQKEKQRQKQKHKQSLQKQQNQVHGSDDEKSAKKAKKGDGKKASGAKRLEEPSTNGQHAEKPGKEGRKNKKKDNRSSEDNSTPSQAVTPAASNPPPSKPAAPKLTPLQASMREKLVSARFRHLNETLYTRPSTEAFDLFKDSPEMFDEYHEGFRRQVKVWPENPVDSFLKDIRARGAVRAPFMGKPGRPQPPTPAQAGLAALPRTAGTCTIADLGCGDAGIADSLRTDGPSMRVEVKSFDLQSPSPLVTKADIANLPLEDDSVNVAIFCLALMGTNWIDFVEEAYRILHWKGELWVAEIKSRFGPVRSKNAPVTHSVGHRRKDPSELGKKAKQARNEAIAKYHEEELAVEVDEAEDRRRETDVSAFVEALRKRGFVVQGEGRQAVDLSNRMFVKMHFIKGAPPTKGKGMKPEAPAPTRGKKPMIKWPGAGDKADESNEPNEASILKPCVYKIR